MAKELAKAYIQIEPTAKGIKGKLNKLLGDEVGSGWEQNGESSGNSFGKSFAKAAIGFISSVAIGKTISSIVSEGADYEQAVGGVETLFKESASIIEDYADEAYKSCGLSATAYMEQSTSFAASLVAACGGNTQQAAELANTALVDMSDNANKMGTDISMLQNAYQGFAKQNYTMLDNLKLGYGGTKTEMERLLDDAEAIKAAQGEVAEYSIDSYADIVEAIHTVQENMNITGTTSKEAATTISGSLSMVKGAWTNVLTAISQGENIDTAMQNLSESAKVFVFDNLIPMFGNILESLPQFLDAGIQLILAFIQGIAAGLPEATPKFAEIIVQIANVLVDNLPLITTAALQLITGFAQGILKAIPVLINALPQIIMGIVDFIIDSIPQIIDTGVQLLTSLTDDLPVIINDIVTAIPEIIDGIITDLMESIPQIVDAGVELLTSLIDNLPTIILTITTSMPRIINSILTSLSENTPRIIQAGVQLLTSLIKNLPMIISSIVRAVPQIIAGLVQAFGQGVNQLTRVGENLVMGLWEGIQSLAGWLWNKVLGWISSIWNGIKNFFEIKSPSGKTDWIGEMLVEGLAGSINANGKNAVISAENMADDINNAMSGIGTDAEINGISELFKIRNAGINDDFKSRIYKTAYGYENVRGEDYQEIKNKDIGMQVEKLVNLLDLYLPDCARTKVAIPVNAVDRAMTENTNRRRSVW